MYLVNRLSLQQIHQRQDDDRDFELFHCSSRLKGYFLEHVTLDVINLILPGPEAWVRENFWPSANPTVRANAMKNVRTKDPIVEESLKVVF